MGAFESLQDLIGAALRSHPDVELASGVLLKCGESIFLQTLTSPLHSHIDLCNQVYLHIL